jgi:sucrose phosphorylase
MLALAGVPGIYFHSLLGSRNDRAGAENSGIPRRINRQKLARADLEAELADAGSLRARVFTRSCELLQARRGCAAFSPLSAQHAYAADPRVFALRRTSSDGATQALCVHNISEMEVAVRLEVAERGVWRELLVPHREVQAQDGRLALALAPYQISWFEGRG